MMEKSKSGNQIHDERSEKVKELQSQLEIKEKFLQDYMKNHGKLQVLFDSVIAAVSAIDPAHILYKPKSESSNTSIENIVQNADWHIGARQDSIEIENINEFNYAIANTRVDDLMHRINRVVDRSRNSYNISSCTVICTGDMVSGDIHDELTRTNEFPVPVQVVKAAELFAKGIITLAQNFGHLKVEYLTADNHARLTKKPQAKEQGINSFNYLVAIIAEKLLSRQNNVEFNIHTEPQKVVNVIDRQYLIMHGHQVRAWSGHAWYGWDRKATKESQSRLSMIMDNPSRIKDLGFHKIIASHFHTPIDTLYYSICGSLSGTDAYDHQAGRYAPPSQPSWFVHPKHGEFGRIDYIL